MSVFKPFTYKENTDVENDSPRKNRFLLFFEIYFRKFWRFLPLNFIYFLVTLPMLICFYLSINNYIVNVVSEEFFDTIPGIGFFASIITAIPEWLFLPLLIVSIALYGPLKMGMTYIFRNFACEEHAWFSDLFARAKSNWKQGMFFGLLDIGIVLGLLNNILGISASSEGSALLILTIVRYISILLFALYLFMRHYFYTLAVTVDLSVLEIMKNALLFSVIGLGRNVLSVLIYAAVWGIGLFIYPIITVFALPIWIYSFCGFSTVFICYPIVEKYVVIPAIKQKAIEETRE